MKTANVSNNLYIKKPNIYFSVNFVMPVARVNWMILAEIAIQSKRYYVAMVTFDHCTVTVVYCVPM